MIKSRRKIGGACSTYGERSVVYGFERGSMKERDTIWTTQAQMGG